jgi:hypothetical protein
LSTRFCSISPRIGPALTTVPSIVRSRPSESAASSGAGAGCCSISAHHAPSRHHRTASGSHAMRSARSAARPQSTATSAIDTSNRLGRSQSQWVAVIPAANSHAAWNSGTAPRPAFRFALRPAGAGLSRVCPEVEGSACIAAESWKATMGVKPIRSAATGPPSPDGRFGEKGRQG